MVGFIGRVEPLDKIDSFATDGLAGVHNSLAYRVHEIEKHLHNDEKWFGVAASASGETHIADRMGPGIAAFALLSGNDAFGSWVQILGSSDTPVLAGRVKFDIHRILVTTTDSTTVFLVQFVVGESAGIAAKLSAEDYTEAPYIASTNRSDSGFQCPEINCSSRHQWKVVVEADGKSVRSGNYRIDQRPCLLHGW